jgi:hypothetical protein
MLPILLAVACGAGIVTVFFLPGKSTVPQVSNIKARNDKLSSIINIIESDYVTR